MSSSVGADPDLKVRPIHGTADHISAEDTAEFAETLADVGYDVQLTTFAGGQEEPPTELSFSTVMEVIGQ